MHQPGTGLGGAGLAGGPGFVVGGTTDHQARAIARDPRPLGCPGDLRDEDLGGCPQRPGGIGHGGTRVAARGGDHPGRRQRRRQQRVEGAARLEAAGGLQQFKF
jgi:hypothetical protein